MGMRESAFKCKPAVTFIEILVAAAISVITLTVVLILLMNCSFTRKEASNLTVATAHAETVLENIKLSNFANIETDINNGSWTFTQSQISADSRFNNFPLLSNETIQTAVIQSGDPLIVSVIVNWSSIRNSSLIRNVEFRTLISN